MRLLKDLANCSAKCVILLNVVGSQEELTPSEIHSAQETFIGCLLTGTVFVMRVTKVNRQMAYHQGDYLVGIISHFVSNYYIR